MSMSMSLPWLMLLLSVLLSSSCLLLGSPHERRYPGGDANRPTTTCRRCRQRGSRSGRPPSGHQHKNRDRPGRQRVAAGLRTHEQTGITPMGLLVVASQSRSLSAVDDGRSRSPLRGSAGFTPASLFRPTGSVTDTRRLSFVEARLSTLQKKRPPARKRRRRTFKDLHAESSGVRSAAAPKALKTHSPCCRVPRSHRACGVSCGGCRQ